LFAVLAGASLAQVVTAVPKFQPPTLDEVEAVRKQGRYLATITLDQGPQIAIVLEGRETPFTVANFRKLADAKFYDGMKFQTVVNEDKLAYVQTGDPTGTRKGGPGYSMNLEISAVLGHKMRAVSMARVEDYPNSAGSQFFIMMKDAPGFDGKYAVFGWVKSEVTPLYNIHTETVIVKVDVKPYGGLERCLILRDPFVTDVPVTTAPAG
jgi:peptidyl-prolyl cis-trans isomerase B (cyclophilin B)